MASGDALPIPRKNVAYRHYFGIYKSDGTIITGWAGATGNISKDGAAAVALTNTPTEIATSFGRGFIDLTSTEMNADAVVFSVTVTNGGSVALTVVLFPMEDVDIRANVVDWSGTAVVSPDTAGYPKVTVKSGTGTGEVSLSSGAVLLQATQTGVTIPTVTTLTNAPSDSAGVTTLLSRLSATRALLLDNLDATISGIATSVWALGTRTLTLYSDSSGITTLLSRLTSTRASLLDNLDTAVSGVSTAVWAVGTRTLTSIADSSGITTLLSRIASTLTITSGKVDVNNVSTIQSGLATQTSVDAVKAKTDNLPSDPADESNIIAATNAILTILGTPNSTIAADILTRLATAGYTVPPTASQNAAATLDATASAHDTTGTIGAAINNADSTAGFAAVEAQLDVIEAKTSLITSDNFTVTSPNLPGTKDLQFTADNDYTLSSGRALPNFSNSDWAVYSLTTAESVQFKTKTDGTDFSLVKDCVVSSDVDLFVELTADELESFAPTISIAQLKTYKSKHTYSVQAVLATGDKVTLAQGSIFIIEDIE